MEFKGAKAASAKAANAVDIGTEWNLKCFYGNRQRTGDGVDIGTEWNLKIENYRMTETEKTVDIGTEWNLKVTASSRLVY